MPSPCSNITAHHLAAAQLPTISVDELKGILSKNGAQELGLGSVQSCLPQEVQEALLVLERHLTNTPPQFGSSIAIGVSLKPSAGQCEEEEFVQKLCVEIKSLYLPASVSGTLELDTGEVRGALCVTRDHFKEIASTLLRDGYDRFSVVAARNSFGDNWHVHDFLTYVLYCGREVGTEVFVGSSDRDTLVIRQRKNGWMRKSHDVLVLPPQTTETTISDTKTGLILPPHVAHRACHATSPQGRQQANLALVMLAFKD